MKKVHKAYSKASDDPDGSYPFPIGFDFALSLSYPEELLRSLPRAAVDSFTGVSNISVFAEIPAGSIVLDLGCGGGTDSLIAAAKTGPSGQVYGVDFGSSMLSRARSATQEVGASKMESREAQRQRIPFADNTFDIAMVNGIFNLNPDREGLFRELARVIRPGSVLYCGEIILNEPMDDEERPALNWFS